MVIQTEKRMSTATRMTLEKLPPAERGPEYWNERREERGHGGPILPVAPDIYTKIRGEGIGSSGYFSGGGESRPTL